MGKQPGYIVSCAVPDATALGRVVGAVADRTGYAILAKANDVQFYRLANGSIEVTVSTWPEGRLFSQVLELRWKPTAKGQFNLLLLTEEPQYLPDGWKPVGQDWQTVIHQDQQRLRLWGMKQDGWDHWVEVRIPKALDYPIAKKTGTVDVGWVEYRDGQGTPRFIRLMEVR